MLFLSHDGSHVLFFYCVLSFRVHRLSNDNTLAGLDTSAFSVASISPTFASNTTSYTLSVPNGVSTINIYATYSNLNVQPSSPFSYKNSGGTTTSGGACGGTCVMGTGSLPALPLLAGDNNITMVIRPEDNSLAKIYSQCREIGGMQNGHSALCC
jgi:hypothetical protein